MTPFFSFLLPVFHSFNTFLGTYLGEFFKTSIELVVLVIISYMIFSEQRREKLLHLNFMSIAFAALTLDKLIRVILLVAIIFGGMDPAGPPSEIFIVLASLEILALVLIANAFTFQARKRAIFFQRVKTEVLSIVLIFTFLLFGWVLNAHMLDHKISNLGIFIFLEGLKLVILGFATFLIIFKMGKEKYKGTVVMAFAFYMITPLLAIIRMTIWDTRILKVISHPFPLIAVLLFTRAIYLKLVDKATLKQQITLTRFKYRQEKELGKMKDEFISTVSHELKTPLTSMRLYLSLLLQGKQGSLNEKQKSVIEIIQSESRRLTELIADLLQLSRLEHKKLSLNVTRVKLRHLVESTYHKNIAERKEIKVFNRIPEEFTVDVDSAKFKQIIINLYGNAVKYTDKKGSIWFDAKLGKDSWSFSVTDNGWGIPKAKQKQIFSKFYQVENYLTRKKGGTGLGLAIAKHIVDLHDGQIKVSSELRKGSTFTVIIPIQLKSK
ncbi:MAG: HAMP domain-containing histidine kinase [Nanoarchaeota archaeon]|nr:HAMP domain-containing histidine kinase [Nanoarchaeota archaeon]